MSRGKNQQVLVLASEERTETVESADFRNARHRGVRVHIACTDSDATPSVVVKIQGKDAITDSYYDILSGAAITGEGDQYLLVYPGIGDRAYDDDAAIAGRRDDMLPAWWRVVATHSDSDEITYSVTADLLV